MLKVSDQRSSVKFSVTNTSHPKHCSHINLLLSSGADLVLTVGQQKARQASETRVGKRIMQDTSSYSHVIVAAGRVHYEHHCLRVVIIVPPKLALLLTT